MTVDNLVSAEVVLADGRRVRAGAAGLIWSLPDVDALPEALRGAPYIGVAGMWAGDPEAGERATRALRKLATRLLDMSGPVQYLDFQRSLDPFFPAGVRRYWKALYLDGLPDAAIDVAADWSGARPSNDTLVIIRHCGGAMARVGAAETAFGDRSAEWMLSIDSTWHDPARDAVNVAYTRAFWDAAVPFSDGKTYFNFPGLLEEGEAAVRASYGANHDRLARIKPAHDPDKRFRLNPNIRPAA
jgi:Berberine and berberine like